MHHYSTHRGYRQVGWFLALSLLFSAVISYAWAQQPPPPKPVPAPQPQQITFKFNPPNGATFIQTETATQTRVSGKEKQTQTTVTKTRMVFKKTAKGYTLTQTPISSSITIGGKTTSAKKLNAPVTYVLAANGKVLTVSGFEKEAQAMGAKLPIKDKKKRSEFVKGVIAGKTAQAKVLWETFVGKYIGKTVKVGDVWKETQKLPLVGAEPIPVHFTTTFVQRVAVNRHNCIRVVMTSVADDKALAAAVVKNKQGIEKLEKESAAKGKKFQLPTPVSLSMEDRSERVIDPATMLFYSESMTKTSKQVVDFPGEGKKTLTTIENTVTKYEYK
ncbi:MAG: DUF6263 family protein [Armatimonadota bacterium]